MIIFYKLNLFHFKDHVLNHFPQFQDYQNQLI